MEDPSKEPMGQGSVLGAGLILLWLSASSLWDSWHAGMPVFNFVLITHTGTFALVLTVFCFVLGWFLTTSAWRRFRSETDDT